MNCTSIHSYCGTSSRRRYAVDISLRTTKNGSNRSRGSNTTTMLRASLDGLYDSLWEERPTLITRNITEFCNIRNMLTERLNVRKQPIIMSKYLRSLIVGSEAGRDVETLTSECNRINCKSRHSTVLLPNIFIKRLHKVTELCISHLFRRLSLLKRMTQLVAKLFDVNIDTPGELITCSHNGTNRFIMLCHTGSEPIGDILNGLSTPRSDGVNVLVSAPIKTVKLMHDELHCSI